MGKTLAGRWPLAVAHAWHAGQPWFLGCNLTPSYAINQIDMWQADTFDLAVIEHELDLAASVGMNAMRVYLHDLVWTADPAGFEERIDQLLEAGARRGIRTMLVFFDSCWCPAPTLGPQKPPIPGVHNSGWVQSPGMAALADLSQFSRLQDYVQSVVSRFASDERVIAWDIWNEPDNGAFVANCDPTTLEAKAEIVLPWLLSAFNWVRSVEPRQPLTSAIWLGDWSRNENLSRLQAAQLANSDIISFHNYCPAGEFRQKIEWLNVHGRPLLCTEFLARPHGSTFEDILPVARQNAVGMFCWGLVNGRTQTHLPWDSWQVPYPETPSPLWFHDVFTSEGTPYCDSEAALLRSMSAR